MKGQARVGFHERKLGRKPNEKVFGNDEQAVFQRKSRVADEKFCELMMMAHHDRSGVSTAPCTDRPRFTPANPPFIRSAGPAALCAAQGDGHQDNLTDFR